MPGRSSRTYRSPAERADRRPDFIPTSTPTGSSKKRDLRRRLLIGDEADAALIREVGNGPLQQNREAVAKTDEHENVQEQPRQPAERAREGDPAKVGQR